MKAGLVFVCVIQWRLPFLYYAAHMYQKIIGTSGKNHFHEMNGDVGMAEWKLSMKNSRKRTTPATSKEVLHPSLHLSIL